MATAQLLTARPRIFLRGCRDRLAGIALLGLVGLGITTTTGCSRPPLFDRPPIIIIDIDTLRADHLGCYGYHRPTSPEIDAFSEHAVRFEWAFAQAPNTPPSQASILTGLYPTTHGRIGDNQLISAEVITLAEVLRDFGYDTAAFVDGGLMSGRYGYDQGFDIYDDEAGHLEKIGPKAADWLLDRLDDPARARRPFLLLVHTYDVHSPYEVTPEPFRSQFASEVDEPSEAYRSNMSGVMADVWKAASTTDPPRLDDVQMAWAVAMYDGGIRHVDNWFGRFMDLLERVGVRQQSIVVVISDHGDEFQEHGSLFHSRLYATVTRIPMIIRFPEDRWRGVVSSTVQSIDLMPTLLAAVGSPSPDHLQGRSLMPLVRGERLAPRTAFSESPYHGRRIAAADAQHRLLWTLRDSSSELYRYREDPLEQHDLSARHAEEADRLEAEMSLWRDRVEAHRYPRAMAPELDEEAAAQLRALGYLE
jgi:arylsulfatase A-like enzyme